MTNQNLKFFKNFWNLICIFDFCILIFNFSNAYALNLDNLKVSFLNADYKAAISEGEKVLAANGRSSHSDGLYYILALSYLKDGNYLRASDIFEIILEEFSSSIFGDEARLGLGDACFLRGDFVKAKVYYKEIINKNTNTKLKPLAYYRLSLLAFKQGDAQEGRGYLDKLKSEFPLNLETKFNQDFSYASVFYTVQVGSFASSANARRLCSKLISQGYEAYTEEAGRGDKRSYRVKVGRLNSRQEAVKLENKLQASGYPAKISP